MADILWMVIMLIFVVGIPYAYSKKGINHCIGIAYAISIVIFAKLFYEYQGADAVLSCFVFSAQLFTFGVNGRDLVDMLHSLSGKLTVPYICCVWTAFLVCPVLSISIVLSYIKKGLDRTTLRTRLFKEIYIFTEKNSNSLALSKDILKNNKKSVVVFSNINETDIASRILCVSYTPHKIVKILNKTNKINICFNDTDNGKLLDNLTEYLSHEYKKNIRVYVITDNQVANEVVDGIKKEKPEVHIEIISPNAILMREILWDYPLYINAKSKEELNVTVLGVGDFGGYFAMNTLWCGVIPDCKFKLNLVDSDSKENILRRVSDNIKEDYFDIRVFNENINTNDFFENISGTRLEDSDYILVATGNDDLNISTSRKIKLHFARHNKNPFVMTVVKNQSRYHVMKETLKKDDIIVVGGTENLYNYEKMFSNKFFDGAFEVFKIVEEKYGHTPTKKDFYAQRQIDILSSYANAIHCRYKIYAIKGKDDLTKEEIEIKLNENLDKIVEAEHNRWVVFEVLKGYIGVKEEELEAFLENNKNTGKIHKNDLLKIHACITDLKSVEKLDNLIYNKYNVEPKLAEIDRLISKNTVNIWTAVK